jgi:hypothetical protein
MFKLWLCMHKFLHICIIVLVTACVDCIVKMHAFVDNSYMMNNISQ